MTASSDRNVVRPLAIGAAVATIAMLVAAIAPQSAEAGAEPDAARLKLTTAEAFDRYVQLTEARNNEELRSGAPFFWVDALADADRARAYAALQRGDVKIERLQTRDPAEPSREIECTGGMIHHRVGMVFVPETTLGQVLAILQDYDHQAAYYSPDVERSRLEWHRGEDYRVFLRFRRHKVISVVLDTEHEVHYERESATRAHSRSSAVRIAEVENAGKADEHEKPPGDDSGFMWRMETWWRMKERDGGVYVQSEVVSLTRDIPLGLGWLIGPFVNSIPEDSLTFTLEATRNAVAAAHE